MPRLSVPDMHCDVCIRAITDAVHAAKPDPTLAAAIDAAGFTALPGI